MCVKCSFILARKIIFIPTRRIKDRAQIFPRQRNIFISRCNLLAQLPRFSDVIRKIDRFFPTKIIVTDIPLVISDDERLDHVQ